MSARSVWGASLPHAPAVGQRWSARKEARGGAARTSRSVRAPQAASLRPGAGAPVPWSRDRSPGIARSSHSRPGAWQRRAAFGDPGSAPRTGGRGPPPPDSGAAAGSPQPLARVARPWCTTPGVSLSVVPCASMLHKRLPGPATAPGAPGTGGCAPCPHAPVPSAAGAYSPRWCPVCQAGQGAHRHLDRSISPTTVPPAVTHGASGEARARTPRRASAYTMPPAAKGDSRSIHSRRASAVRRGCARRVMRCFA